MKKRLRVFAGPNGSGKTSLYSYLTLQHFFQPYFYINPDTICKELITTGFSISNWPIDVRISDFLEYFTQSSFSHFLDMDQIKQSLEFSNGTLSWSNQDHQITYICAAIADFLRNEMIHSNSSFACETVFSHPSKLDFLLRAKQLGYTTYLYFISTEEPLINIGRVQNRVEQGGHAVPEEKIIARYNRTMANLLPALHLVDRAFIFDNSSSGEGEAYQNFAEVLNREITLLTNTVPAWFKKHVLDQV